MRRALAAAALLLAGCSSSGLPTSATSSSLTARVTTSALVAEARDRLGGNLPQHRILQLATAVCDDLGNGDDVSGADIAIEQAPGIRAGDRAVNDFVQAAVLYGCPVYWAREDYYRPTRAPSH